MSRSKYIFALAVIFASLILKAQPNREYSLVSLMNGQGTFESDSGSLFDLPLWGYGFNKINPTVDLPGPTIYANQGDSVHISMFNPSMEGHTIHLHGLDVDEANDGVPHFTGFIQEGESFTYKFKATHAGNFLYHCHVTTTMHLTLGMYGMVIVYPTDSSKSIYDGGPFYDRQYEFLLSEMDARWNSDYTSIGTFLSFDPDLFFLITDLAMYLAAAGLPSAFGRAVIPVSRLHSVGAPTLNQLHPSVAQVSNIPSFT